MAVAAFGRGDREALVAARFAEMKAALQLNSDQEKHWPEVESTLHKVAAARASRREEVTKVFTHEAKSGGTVDVPTRLSTYAAGLRARADQADELARAFKPLLGTLDEHQSRRLGLLLARNRRRSAGARQLASTTRYMNGLIAQAGSKA